MKGPGSQWKRVDRERSNLVKDSLLLKYCCSNFGAVRLMRCNQFIVCSEFGANESEGGGSTIEESFSSGVGSGDLDENSFGDLGALIPLDLIWHWFNYFSNRAIGIVVHNGRQIGGIASHMNRNITHLFALLGGCVQLVHALQPGVRYNLLILGALVIRVFLIGG